MASFSPIPCQRALFDLPDDVAYLNCASRSPMPRAVAAEGVSALRAKLRPWTLPDSDALAERTRALFARVVGADERAGGADAIALTPSTSYAISQAAHNLAPLCARGAKVLVLEDQMSSNVYPWQALCARTGAVLAPVPYPADGDWTRALCERDDWGNVAVAALPQCHWADGSLVDLRRVARRLRDARGERAALVVDATQSLGALPLDAAQLDADVVCASAHKWLFGGYGCSLCYVGARWRTGARAPWEPLVHDEHARAGADGDVELPFSRGDGADGGGGTAGYPTAFKPGARRLDAGGRPNPVVLPTVAAGLELVLSWGVADVAATLGALGAPAVARARALGLWVPSDGHRAPHLFGVRPGDWAERRASADDLAWCARAAAALRARGVHVTGRLGAIRTAPHVYNTPADMGAYGDALAAFVEEEAARADGARKGAAFAP